MFRNECSVPYNFLTASAQSSRWHKLDGDVFAEPHVHCSRTAQHNPVYEDIATEFFEHFLHIAEAIGESGIGLWDEQDEFY